MTRLVEWPAAAKVDRVIPKERLYAEASASVALKKRFVDDVQRVRWAYKLGEETLRLAAGKLVTEIQVFVIDLKGLDLDSSVLESIDASIPSQIIFELHRGDDLLGDHAMTAAYKRAGGTTKGADYFRSTWIGAAEPRTPLPPALHLDGLYALLIGKLLPYPIRQEEELSDALNRMDRIRGLSREISVLEKRMRSEVQFNRKVELRNELRIKQSELNEHVNGGSGMTEDAAWRN